MDFTSLMKAQISKSKPTAPPKNDAKTSEAQKQYLKRSEIEAQREAAYLADQKALEEARLARLEKKRKLEDDTAEKNREREEKRRRLAEQSARLREEEEEAEERARRKRLGLPDLPPKNLIEEGPLGEGEADMEDTILVEKLREMGEPVVLFGETHRERLKRYRRLTGEDKEPVLTKGPIPTYLELVPEAEMKVRLQVPKDAAGRKFLFRQLASYFTVVLEAWEIAMAMRTDEVKASYSGKAATNAMVQARENLRPFFKKLEKGDLEDSILEPVVEIVHSAQERRYVDANDGYLRLSIGKAAWPIGVTMVGIHERSAREKLHESDKGAAHIMSDELTRKYLQSIKRCLSFAQTRWPPDDQLQLMG
ncbi:pre-mRNA splicing factor [Tothia fuscella]|uniref:Pre-mRNA-splicing factor 18 n=1 Tax=Tothia fuscella TaxID=1048955 RepID=A0A9P4NUU1_9PEZI|nr:pre-mRNA splicing factor [Tothia fuscella]